MTDEYKRYGIHRGFFNTACVVLIMIVFFRACASSGGTTSAPPVANYQARFCEAETAHDFTNKNPLQITVALHDQCFGDHVLTPLAWNTFFIQKSQATNDWAALWCNGQPTPSAPRPYYQDMGNTFDGCRTSTGAYDFYLQGKGTITFRRTSVRPDYTAQSQGETHGEAEPDRQYTLTPTKPSGGDPDGYAFVIQQCYRSHGKIECWGNVTNRTDAPTEFVLRYSTAVDDEGNSIFSGTFGGGFSFPGANSMYGSSERLLPSVPTKFIMTINDAHQNVRTIHLDVHVQWEGSPGRYDELVFEGIPVQ